MKTAIVCGAGGFIGGHMVNRLIDEGYRVTALDIKPYQDWEQINKGAFNYYRFDLRNAPGVNRLIRPSGPDSVVDEIYQFAADMGGAGYIFT